MTLRARLTAAFLAVVLGPVLVGAVAVGVTTTRVARAQETERLHTASSTVRTATNALCQRARAAAEALAAATSRGVDGSAASANIVARGLADAARVENGTGVVTGRAGGLPDGSDTGPWADCTSARTDALVVAAVVELWRPNGALAGRALAAFALTDQQLDQFARAAGVDLAVVAADGTVLAGAVPGGPDVRTWQLQPTGGQPWRLALSTPRRDLGGLYSGLAMIAVLVAAVAVVAARFLSRMVTRPLGEVAMTAEHVAAGDLSARVPVRARDEIGRLAGSFNHMTREMQAYVAALTSSRDQIRGTLARLGDTLSSTHDLDRILAVILETVLASSGAEAGVVLLTDPSGRLVARHAQGIDGRIEVAVGEGLLGSVAAAGEARLGRLEPSGRLPGGDPLAPGEPVCKTFIAVPFSGSGRLGTLPDPLGREPANPLPVGRSPGALMAAGQLLGVLALYDRLGADDFDDVDLATLRTFAGQAAVAVENVLLHEQAERGILIDPVTGLWNHKYLAVLLRREMVRALRFQRSLAVLLLDVNNLPTDHADDVLAIVAARIVDTIREVDMVFRANEGGFAIVLPETGHEGAEMAAERLLAELRETPVRLASGQIVECVASIGAALHPADADADDPLLRRAMQALRAAGPNMSVFADQWPEQPVTYTASQRPNR